MEMDRRDLSNVLGWASGFCWLIVSFPQYHEIYKTKSGRGVSLAFMLFWTVGDAMNLIGCMMSYQLATQLYIALWYLLMDFGVLSMMAYYDYLPEWHDRLESRKAANGNERQSLIGGSQANSRTTTVVNSVCALIGLGGLFGLVQQGNAETSQSQTTVARVLLSATGGDVCPYAGWVCKTGIALGWASSLDYLVARIPQIIQNAKRKSTEGLSVWMFVLSLFGNVTYSGAIFAWSCEKDFLMEKFPWILGSLGTVAFDIVIVCQCCLYGHGNQEKQVQCTA